MRRVNDNKWLGVLALVTSLQAVGCTTAVLQAGADDPRAFALLPVAVLGDLIAAAAGDSASSSSAPPTPDPSPASWEDPDDWVAACDGPILCEAPKSFVCYGVPGDCYCACSVNVASASGAGAMASMQ